MTGAQPETLSAIEIRERNAVLMAEQMFLSGFEVKPRINSGYVVSTYVKEVGTVEASFTTFQDMVQWLTDTLAEDLA